MSVPSSPSSPSSPEDAETEKMLKMKEGKVRRGSCGSVESGVSDHFIIVNERPVEDVSLDLFYKPHTISLLFICIIGVISIAFSRNGNQDFNANVFTGICGVTFFFMVISILTFPHGPFTRPHPIIWRMVFGLSVIYLLMIQFLIHQDYDTVRGIIVWIDPNMANYSIDAEKEYGQDCWDVNWERIYNHLDWFAFGHYWGWGMKALIIRHYGICWSISIMWELTEMAFGHLLPNFFECWWDNFILDVLICNGLGIFTGMMVCRWLEMREYHWESFKDISSTKGRVKRALLQFTPESWTPVRWLDPTCSWMRFVSITQFMLVWQTVELNTFFVKHIFPMPVAHPICVIRILLFGLMAAPSTRQYYMYITDPQVKRLGSQTWVFLCICLSELIMNIKFGLDLFSQTQMVKIGIWLCLIIIVSCLGTFVSMKIYKWRYRQGDPPIIVEQQKSFVTAPQDDIVDKTELRKRKVRLD